MVIKLIDEVKNRVLAGKDITVDEALALSRTNELEALYAAADEIRIHFMGDKVDLCSIMNAQSGRCSEDCKWCSQSRHFKTGIPEYGLVSTESAVTLAQEYHKLNVEHFSLVTSGRALKPKQIDRACEIYDAIRNECSISLCASMGLLRTPELSKLKESGVDRYHCNIETAPSYFDSLCTTHTIEDKQRTIREAQALGMKICSGGIWGMGETMQQRIEMAFVLREMHVDSIPINILNPIAGTPLESALPLDDDDILLSFALYRFINPAAHIRFAGGRSLILHIQEKALKLGVSAMMVGDYLTTSGADIDKDNEMLSRLGRA